MLRFAEEILMLLLNEEQGDLAFVPEPALHRALAGSVLMDLALEDRIDTDLERLMVVDTAPVGDPLLDPTLAQLAESKEVHGTDHWVREVAKDGERIRAGALDSLVKRGILRSAEEGAMMASSKVARAGRYPTVDGKAQQEVRLRVMGVLFSDDVPDARDIIIIGLADACGVFERLLSKEEFAEVADRIAWVGKLDLIGQAVARAVQEAEKEEEAPPPPAKTAPQAKGLPLIGCVREASQNMHSLLTRQYLEHGPVFELPLMNHRLLVMAGPEANRFAQRKGRLHFTSYHAWWTLVNELGANRLALNMDGKEHVAMRKALAPGYSRARVHAFLDTVTETVFQRLAEWPADRPMHPLTPLQQVIADQMGAVLAGASAADYFKDLVAVLEIALTKAFNPHLALLSARKFKKAKRRADELARNVLKSHMPGGALHGADDLVTDLVDLHNADPLFMPEVDLIPNVLAPYLVGIETVASTCAFTLYATLKHPDLKARMTEEADEFFSGPRTAERLQKMEVTHRVLLESLRMYPAVAGFARTVTNAFDFEGHHVPAGKAVMIGTSVTLKLPECFPDPHRFDIDRYLPDRAEHRQSFAFAPFGLGTHRCLGADFAASQTLATIASILHAADLELDDPGYEMKITSVPTPRPNKHFKIRIKGLRRQAA